MRLVTFQKNNGPSLLGAFIETDRRIVDVSAAHEVLSGERSIFFENMQALIDGGDVALDLARTAVLAAPVSCIYERADVRLLAPLNPPAQMRDCSCFELHLQQAFASARKYRAMGEKDPLKVEAILADTSEEDKVLETFRRQPIYYKANRFAVCGHEDDVHWPAYSRAMDFELEWGCYIGKIVKNASIDEARASIFGYTIFNDFSARDTQALEMSGQLGPAKGKDFDGGNAMGPCIVTKDEFEDPYALAMIARVNGEEWGRGSTRDMYWSFEDVIVHISKSETLHPGEFLGSGTVGNGCGLERMKVLRDGDVVELEVENIGVLRNTVFKTKPK